MPYKYWASPATLDDLLKDMAAHQVSPFSFPFLKISELLHRPVQSPSWCRLLIMMPTGR